MKRLIAIILLVNYYIGFSQEYRFNLLTKYETEGNDYIREMVVYSNVDDPHYFLSLKKTDDANLADLYDVRNQITHHFDFIESQENGQILFTFKFIKTEALKPATVTNYQFTFETIHQDSLYKSIKMTMYKNKKMKNTVRVYELKAKRHAKNLFPLFRYSNMHFFEDRTDIDLGENYIIESSKKIGKSEWAANLTFYQEVDMVIKI